MRRWSAVLVILSCLCFCGCKESTTPPQTSAFTSVVSFSVENETVTATLRRAGNGQLALVCRSPASLAGMHVVMDGERVTLSRGALEWDVPLSDVLAAAPFLRLCRILDTVSCLPTADGVVTGTCDGLPYTLTFDPKTGALVSLEAPSGDFSVAFSDFLSNVG